LANDALSIRGLIAGYGAVRALDGVSMDVGPGQTVALLGGNGNGKTTLMRCALGLVKPWEGEIRATLGSRSAILSRLEPEEIVGLGVVLVPEGRRLFKDLTSRIISRSARIGRRPAAATLKTWLAASRSFRRFRKGANSGSAP
jgi:branched-chain amino acid transport system ATP-binding protein